MVESNHQNIKPYLVIAGILSFTALVTRLTGVPVYDPSLPVKPDLPVRVGEWEGRAVLFCQNSACGRQYSEVQNESHGICPACGSQLDAASPGERASLPPDSLILRRRYENGQGEWVSVVVVVSGHQRSSIHRPEWCLPGQGLRIVGSAPSDVTLSPGRSLGITLMDVTVDSGGDGHPVALNYAYWFCSPGHVTASQLARFGWMTWDSVVHGTLYRWAYVTMSTPQEEGPSDRAARLRQFLPPFWAAFRVQTQGRRPAIQSAPSREER